MVVVTPSLPAFDRPAANVAVVDRLGVGGLRRECERGRIGERGKEPGLRRAVVGHVIVDAQPLDGMRAAAQRHVHPLGLNALDLR